MLLQSMAERTAELFAKCFGEEPCWTVAAPGRVNLIGEHTDYNEGFVLPMAIQKYTLMAGRRTSDREVTLHSETTGDTAEFSVRQRAKRGDPPWSNYVRGVVAGFQDRGQKIGGFSGVIDSTLPYGGGLASSAALEVAAATLLEALYGKVLDPMEKALLCQKAEHDFAGVPCGIMDQYTSILAKADHALLLDCRTRETTLVPMQDPSVTVLIINTNVRHRLAEGEYAKRRAQCEIAAKALGVPALRDVSSRELQAGQTHLDPVVFRRARHVVTENERTLLMARAIQAGDWGSVGKLMYESHASLRDDYQVSCPELDAVVEIARSLGKKSGVIGCRMTGAGFGGCAVSLVRTDALSLVTRRIEEGYERQTDNQPGIFSSRPAGGAEVLK
jgi:galactokinase